MADTLASPLDRDGDDVMGPWLPQAGSWLVQVCIAGMDQCVQTDFNISR